ncbi:MAG TPA: hypothetical protein VGG50_10620 [Streptosporangiaceae bacterium]
MRGKLSGIAAVAAVAAAIAVPVTGASASTSRCTEGVMQPQCGDFVNPSGNGWAVYKQRLQPGTPVIAYPDVRRGKQITSDRSTDFYVFTPATRAQLNRSFEYAPDGLLSGLCLADLDNPNLVHPNGVVLRWCNGSPYQQWQASEANGNPRSLQWRNVASRGWIQANGTGKQLSTSTAAKRPAGAFWAWNTPAKAQG